MQYPCHFCDGKGYVSGGYEFFREIKFPCYTCNQTGMLDEDWATLIEVHKGCWVVKGNKTPEELAPLE